VGWSGVADAADVPPGAVLDVVVGEVQLALWRTSSGRLVACDARCPHQWSSLAHEGVVDGEELVCTAHFWRFGPDGSGWKRSMAGRIDPKSPVETHPCRERDGRIEVDLA
jgi:phenylpropionate dioxygenase-like ring-hydroxylating dioxygenase large terminal subunit